MKLEVFLESDNEVRTYPINKPRITLGTSEECDIVIDDPGVSRKHLILISEGDQCFVLDPGSRNGSYINEVPLAPGSIVEFNSFFPVRLGDKVLITLVLEEDTEEANPDTNDPLKKQTSSLLQDKTSVIDLATLNAARSQELIKKRSKIPNNKNSAKKSTSVAKTETLRMRIVLFVTLAMLGTAGYYTLRETSLSPDDAQPEAVHKTEQKVPTLNKVVTEEPKPLNQKDLVTHDKILSLKSMPLCTSPDEIFLCQNFSGASSAPWGVVQIGEMIYVLVEGNIFRAEAIDLLLGGKDIGQKDIKDYEESLSLLTAALAIHRIIPVETDYARFKTFNLTLALFMGKDESNKEIKVVSLRFSDLKAIKNRINADSFKKVNKYGIAQFLFLKNYLAIY